VTAERAGQSVLVVDDAPENLRVLSGLLLRGDLVPRPVLSGQLALAVARLDPPDLVLLDVDMPGLSGLEVCRRLKEETLLRAIPVVFISGLQGTDDKVEAFRAGAVDYITRPFHDLEVIARLKTHLRLQALQVALVSQTVALEQQVAAQVRAITASQLSTIYALAKLAEARDVDTGQHIERVQSLGRALAIEMRRLGLHPAQLTDAFVDDLEQAAALHDIGKVGTPDAVLLKPGALSPAERTEMNAHCALGAQTLATVLRRHPDNQFLRMGVDVARSHHERWDGTGYPDGLAGAAIPLVARIVALADFYDAMTSPRVYRPALGHEETCALIQEGSGRHFDPEAVLAFGRVAEELRCIAEALRG
jgi:putative two-component system response regulator